MASIVLWIVTAIQSIFAPILEYLGKRAAIYSTIVLAFIALTATFAVSFQTALTLASTSLVDGFGIMQYAGLILPSNFPLVVSIIINAKVLRFGYEYMIKTYDLSKS